MVWCLSKVSQKLWWHNVHCTQNSAYGVHTCVCHKCVWFPTPCKWPKVMCTIAETLSTRLPRFEVYSPYDFILFSYWIVVQPGCFSIVQRCKICLYFQMIDYIFLWFTTKELGHWTDSVLYLSKQWSIRQWFYYSQNIITSLSLILEHIVNTCAI